MTDRLRDPVVFAASTLALEPHAAQIPYLLDQAHRVKLLVGGRRSGKSYATAVEVAFHAVRAIRERRPFRQLIVAPARDQARLLLGTISKLLRASPLGGLIEAEVESPFHELRLACDGLVFVRAAHEQGKLLRGHAADRAVVDEAAYVPREVIQEGLTPVLADTNGALVLASTPTMRGTWFEAMFEQGRRGDPRVASYVMRSSENPHISAAYVDGQRAQLTARQFDTEYEGRFADAGERVFAWDHVIACAVGGEDEPRGDARYVVGWDPAARRDRSALVVLDCTAKPWRAVKLADLKGADYLAQAAAVASVARRYNRARIVIDATCQTVLADLLRREGDLWVEAVVFTAESKAALVMNLALLVERHEVLFPASRDLLDEFARYEARTAPSGSVRFGAAGSGAFDDTITALALAAKGAGATTAPRSFASEGLPPWLTSSSPIFFSGARVVAADGLPDEWDPL